jgi:hypothetical protein
MGWGKLYAIHTLSNREDETRRDILMVELIAADESKFRNVHPKDSELYVKDFQKKAWTLMS